LNGFGAAGSSQESKVFDFIQNSPLTEFHMTRGLLPEQPSADEMGGAHRIKGATASSGIAVVFLGGFLLGSMSDLWGSTESPSASRGHSRLLSTPKPPSDLSPAPGAQPPPKSTSPESADLAARWDSIADLQGDALLSSAADLGLLEGRLLSLYQEYRRERGTARDLVAGGLGENHPDVRDVHAGLRMQRRQLLAAVHNLQENAQTVRTRTTAQRAAAAIPVFHLSADQSALFHWGNPTNGLRLALCRPESVGEKDTGAIFDYRMIIQNISNEAITLDLARSAERSPRLNLRQTDRTLASFTGDPPSAKVVVLPPHSAASVPLFPKRPNVAAIKVYDASVALSVELELGPSPGAWSGRLVSPDTFGLFARQ
jgi:hypothetical protein